MRRPAAIVLFAAVTALAACGTPRPQPAVPPVPGAGPILDVATGATIRLEDLVRRLDRADIVLLGEVHDNPIHHRLRAGLIASAAAPGPTVVFEHFPFRRDSVLATRPAGALEPWLDAAGFDRAGWRWPLHQPLVEATLERDLPRRGSQLDRATIRAYLGGGAPALADLRALVARVPLDSAAQRTLDQTLVDGHCGQLPASAIPPLRDAQAARDAAMATALASAPAGRGAWLLAGNGHVRKDFGVPRLLPAVRPGARVVSVGFLEAGEGGALPSAAERAVYDVVWVTDAVSRPDPCAAFRRQS